MSLSAFATEGTVKRIKLGISACLLGQKVRYDGGHRRDPFLVETFGRHVEFVPLCPEAACGLGVPREPLRLEKTGQGVRLVTVRTGSDMTGLMERCAAGLLDRLQGEALWGFIVKSRSPSCGTRVAVHGPGERSKEKGLFLRMAEERFALLPVEDEKTLHLPEVREHFIRRLFTLKRWRDLVEGGADRGRLLAFHGRHRLLLRAHSEAHCREMGRLVARAGPCVPSELYADYQRLLLGCVARRTTARRHAAVLLHVMGRLKERLTADEREEMEEVIGAFRAGDAPLIVPAALINHFLRSDDAASLRDQFYLCPDPAEAALLYHA